jgi:hypothetical protein
MPSELYVQFLWLAVPFWLSHNISCSISTMLSVHSLHFLFYMFLIHATSFRNETSAWKVTCNLNGQLFRSYRYICSHFLLQWCYPTSNMKVSTSSLISMSDIFAPFSENSNSRSRNASLFFFPAIIIYKTCVFLLADKVVSHSFLNHLSVSLNFILHHSIPLIYSVEYEIEGQ